MSESLGRATQAKPAPAPRPVHRRRETCRACGGRQLEPVLALGPQPLANAFLQDPADAVRERHFPLDVVICTGCGLVQLVDVIDPEVLFGHYLYVTGTSETIAAHNVAYASRVIELLGLTARHRVVEIASNDGSLLSCFKQRGVGTLGVEPARNIAQLARERGIDTVNAFFNSETARALRAEHGPAAAVIANNVLAHVDDPSDFLLGCRELLDEGGLAIIEVPYAGDMLERREFDTIYHEHLCYFALAPLSTLAAGVGMRIVRVERVPVHGGSIRVYFGAGAGDASDVSAMIAAERASGLTTEAGWRAFGDAAKHIATTLHAVLADLRDRGHSLAGYGAPAKGNTLLNFAGIGPELVPFLVDRNPLKVGRWTPGTHISVRPVETLAQLQPDYVLILAWNFADEIMRQQSAHTARGGGWILPIPEPRVLAPSASRTAPS